MIVSATDLIIWTAALLVTVLGSGFVVKALVRYAGKEIPDDEVNPGRVIGKLENVLVLFFVAVGGYTALAVIFAAKGMVRTPKDDASYYILGTLANFTWALSIAGVARLATSIVACSEIGVALV